MKKIYRKIVLIFFIAISSTITFAGPISTNITNAQTKQYFSDLSLDALSYIKKYSSIPQNRRKVDPERYARIVIRFWAWMNRTINEKILPPQSVVTNNIVLVRADYDIYEDIAYCAYSFSNASFLVVQNVETVMLFTDYQLSFPSNDALLKDYLINSTASLLHTNILNKLAEINVKRFDSYYIAGAISTNESLENWAKYIVPIKIITDGKQIFISMERGRLGYPMPATTPLPSDWFEFTFDSLLFMPSRVKVDILEAQVRLKPEALEVSPGILTAFVRLPEGYSVTNIITATCDRAFYDQMMPNDDGTEMIVKFRRKDIEAALRQWGESLDTSFVVRGAWKDGKRSLLFKGTASITKIVGAKEKPEKSEKPEKPEKQGK